jgi:hypothetical protein
MDDIHHWQSASSPVSRQLAERQFETVRRTAVTSLAGLLAGFWGDIEEQVRLAAIASHDNRAIYDDRLAIQLLNQRALELASRYRESLEQAFDRWRNPRPRAVEAKGMSLMSEGELEIHLAGQQIIELLENQLMHPLHLLHERFDALGAQMGLPRQAPETNPLRPEVPVNALVKLISDHELTPELRRLIFLQLEKRLSKLLVDLYDRVNGTLENNKPLPDTAKQAQMPQQPQQQPQGWQPEGGLADDRMGPNHGQGQYGYRYRETIHEQVRAWRRSALGNNAAAQPTHSGYGAPMPQNGCGQSGQSQQQNYTGLTGARVLAPQELFGIASLLQGTDPAPYVRALSLDDPRSLSAAIRAQIANGSRQLGFDPTQMRFSENDEDTIDLTALLFQTLSHSHAAMPRSRAMFGRLVVPYLKLALTDSALFDERAHPGRRLLEALSEACDGNTGDSPQDQQTLTHAELAVDRVVDGYRDDQAIFELAAAELRDHLDQQRRMREVAELRAAEAVNGRERLLHARRSVDEVLASRLYQRPISAGIAEFLTTHWRHHLVQSWLREGPDSAQYLAAIAVGDGLIQADADAARARGAQVADRVIELQGPLGRCYASCGLDASAARESMARIVSALAFPDQPRAIYSVPADDHISEAAESTSWGGLRVVGGTDTLEFDPALAARLRKIRVGQNLRMIEDDGRESMGRVAWVSPITGRFLVVNRRGQRKLVVSPEELAALVGKGRVILRSSEAPFDEAMRSMWGQLERARSSNDPVGAAAS